MTAVLSNESAFEASDLDKVSFKRKQTNAAGITTSTNVEIPILNSESDNEAFLYLLSQFALARRVFGWNNGDVV